MDVRQLERVFRERYPDAFMQHDDRLLNREHAESFDVAVMHAALDAAEFELQLSRLYL